jgi:peptidoglycan/LPS O-acetylase OafA/YrhL
VLIIKQHQRAWRLVEENAFAVAFCFLFFLAYVALYAWYDVVVTDSRFILSLFLPFLVLGATAVLRLGEDWPIVIRRSRFTFAQLIGAALICLALIDLAYNALRIARLVS